jgi:SPP1 family predicted phage head-tail adaptor
MLTRLPHRIEIQTLSTTAAGGGTFTETWTTTATRWANVQVQRANEEFGYGKDQQANTYRIVMRKENFTNKQRIVFKSLVLTIETIDDPTQDGRLMVVIARGELT